MKKIIEKIKKSVLVKRTTTILFVIILVALFISLTLWINKLNLNPIDFTKEKLYTLTDTSKERIANITEEVNIYFVGYSEQDSIMDLAKQYHSANNNINVEIVTSTSRPDIVQKYGIEENTSCIIVENGQKSKVLLVEDLYVADPATYEQIDITEEKLTNSILYVVAEKIPTVYFLEGYSEFSINGNMSYLAIYLANEITSFKTVNTVSQGKIPEDCDTLVVNTPNADFDDITTNAILEYINNGGNILWFNSVSTKEQNMPNVNKILATYGVAPFTKGYISETDALKRSSTAASIILPEVKYSAITKNVSSPVFINSSKINFASDEDLENLKVTKNVLLEASETSFIRTNFEISYNGKLDSEEGGPFVIGAELQKQIKEENTETGEKVSKLVIYGENYFVSNYTIDSTSQTPFIAYLGNRQLVTDTIAYLVDRQEDIVIRKDTNIVNYTATVAQNNIIQWIIFGVPVIIILIGILVWQHRRRKK